MSAPEPLIFATGNDPDHATIRLPICIAVNDYHELHFLAELLTDLSTEQKKVVAKEIGFHDGRYIGVLKLSRSQYPAGKEEIEIWKKWFKQLEAGEIKKIPGRKAPY